MFKLFKIIIHKCKSVLFRLLIKIYSLFIRQNQKQVLIYPNLVSYKQLIDVKNFTHECVLVFFNYIIKEKLEKNITDYEYVLVYYQDYQRDIQIPTNSEGMPLYKHVYCPIEQKKSLKYIKNIFGYYHEYFKSHIIISGDPLAVEKLKKRNQIEFCISYYASFKSDFLRRPKKISNINYVISPSKICSQIDSLASNVPYERYVHLGLPKWESLLNPRYSKEQLFSFFGYLKLDSKIIMYTPTHRGFEINEDTNRGFLGENKDYEDLNQILKSHNAFLFVKIHITQNIKVIKNIKDYSNIKFFNPTHDYNLYDVLPYTDLLISDYTSTYFDYLVLKKPALFYWFDVDKYIESRGFSWDPIDSVFEGNVAYNYNELVDNISLFLDGNYPVNYQKIEYIKRLVLGNNDDLNICQRIYDFIKTHS